MIQHTIIAKVHDDSLVLKNMKASVWEQMMRNIQRKHGISLWTSPFVEKSTEFDKETQVWTCKMTWWQSEDPELFVKLDKANPSQ